MILASHGIIGSQIVQIVIPTVSDADAQGFVDRVYLSGGVLSATELTAVNDLVIDLKNDAIWTKMKAIYPMVGASAAACAQNLKSSSFTGTFTSGWTFASTGATPNGTSAYMDTGLNSSIVLSQDNKHISSYVRTNINQTLVGCGVMPTFDQLVYFSGIYGNLSSDPGVIGHTPTKGLYLTRRINSTTSNTFANNILIQTDNKSSNGNPNKNLYIGARNYTTPDLYSNSQFAFASIGDGLTDTEASNFYTSVQAFQTTLSRQV